MSFNKITSTNEKKRLFNLTYEPYYFYTFQYLQRLKQITYNYEKLYLEKTWNC